jgi:SSS family solute:Na+ symporter
MLILRLLPAGLIGLVAAGFIASTMVSIASLLNSASTLITMDVVRQLNPSLSDRRIVKVGQWCTVALLAAAVSWAPQLQLFPSLWQYLQAVLAYVVPPVVALFLCGMFWRAATANAASATMLIGSLCGLALFLSNVVFGWTHIHFLYAAPLLTALDVVILATVSAFAPVSGSHESTMWQTRFGRAENPRVVAFWQDYRFLAAGLLALTAAIVIIFR